MQINNFLAIYYIIAQVITSSYSLKTYNYGITHDQRKRLTKYQSTSVDLKPLEDTLKIEEILKKIGGPDEIGRRQIRKSRKLHGVLNEPFGKPLILSGKTHVERKPAKKVLVPRSEQSPDVPFLAAYGKPSFAIQREEDSDCYTNRFGYRCCDQALESIIMKSYEKLLRRTGGIETNLSKIASTLRKDTRQVFAKNFEAIVSRTDFGSTVSSDFTCKVELGPERLIAQVFVPDSGFDTPNRRRRIPYHELSREDLSEPSDLVISKNGILVSQ
uniref:Ground-like domain-containing protein n=1 Tax=Caenorhabditis japonica TaxID=281687 RepID=A0A8R1E552_CAEJA